jgi:Bax protein
MYFMDSFMIRKFEGIALITAGGLVSSLFAVAILHPPDTVTSPPRAVFTFLKTNSAILDVQKRKTKKMRFLPIKARGAEDLLANADVRVIGSHKPEIEDSAYILDKTFTNMGYDLDQVRSGAQRVPRVFLASMPDDIGKIREVPRKKALFFKTALPLILKANAEIHGDRRRLLDLKSRLKKLETLPAKDRLWLIVMFELYRVERGELSELLKRVDIIPVSLALAQAAVESGWGTSRFIREGNAMFGQWTTAEDEGLVPNKREGGKTHKVKAFKNLLHSARSYVWNLNTHKAYRGLRTLRQQLRNKGVPIRGMVLVESLIHYSERGEEYVKDIRSLITINKLKHFDEALLISEA